MWPTATNTAQTLELRQLVENGVNLWDFEYPSYYKGSEKSAFEQKVLDHFWLRQIGAETPGRFLHYFRCTMREIMPLYIQRYKSQEIMERIEDPFGNVDVTETFTQTTEGTAESTVDGTGTTNMTRNDQTTLDHGTRNSELTSDTPQSATLATVDGTTEAVVANKYLSNVVQTIANTKDTTVNNGTDVGETTDSQTGSSSSSSTVTHTLTRKGNQGVNTYAHDMNEFRTTFLNIDMEIIGELEKCFLGVF